MDELLKTTLYLYIFSAIFCGGLIVAFIIGIIKKTRKIENTKIKIFLRILVCGVLTTLWIYHFVYANVYPFSLAYYEYRNSLTEEKVGVIKSIEQDGKDRILVTVDGTVYTMVYSSLKPYKNIDIAFKRGDTVWILIGVHSLFIFDISKVES